MSDVSRTNREHGGAHHAAPEPRPGPDAAGRQGASAAGRPAAPSGGLQPGTAGHGHGQQMPDAIIRAQPCVIRVLGVGGGGVNSLQHMINESIDGVEFIAVNTDAMALSKCTAATRIQIGAKITNGLGAGGNPNVGRRSAEESAEEIKQCLTGADMIFITAGLGGGTGTGASPVIAAIAKQCGALTVAVVTKPFGFEGKRHRVNAEAGLAELAKSVDSFIIIDNNKLLSNLDGNMSIVSAFKAADDVLLNAIRAITDIITKPGFINLDFNDVRNIMLRSRGYALIGTGIGSGTNFVEEAMHKAICSPLVEHIDVNSAAGLLFNIAVNPNYPIFKLQEICDEIEKYAEDDAQRIFGIYFDDKLSEDQIGVTILITGISNGDFLSRQEGGAAEAQDAASPSGSRRSVSSDAYAGAGRDPGLRADLRAAEGPDPGRPPRPDEPHTGPGPRGQGRGEGGWDLSQGLRGRHE